MPQIFDDVTRKQIRINMLDNGYELIKKNGYKKTSVEEIAKSCSLAKGTFYNFFTEYFLNENNDEKTSTWILSHVEVKQNNCNWKVFANYLKALAIVNSKNDLLHQDVLNITMDCLISDILDYVYES
ncbi:TetR/AcrR family transcriptional regulator [Clostridium estertheticum]|uniref:HTH tetR-type domain-containing protein n=1 Tax=Clostridium estertheticum subsp. estertheticum TaxID=1552 RepID=A0A1J0GC86_9CLOT|nr:helix-turn-helix domain-containing protein [Clostridium estertheticum]APC38953.1 hypothetical protein A7L45_02170 [Clostridium estertheticum subsp. estertheticum]MBZ9615093.1 TetR/AcrR family transcriptional regulator [Clostridium estertheticum subsp. laramiense]WAG74992.1 TetR/AcrR family transcriptional regulator [Clostridium estertheticum]